MNKQEEIKLKPIPHYPDWRYYCPICKQFWESELYHDNWECSCPDCRGVATIPIIEENKDE